MASNQEDPPRETHSDANHEEDDPAPLLSEPITSKEWWGLVRYFLGGAGRCPVLFLYDGQRSQGSSRGRNSSSGGFAGLARLPVRFSIG